MQPIDWNLKSLKIKLMVHGVFLDDDIIERLHKGRFGEFTFQDYPTTGGLILELDSDIFVNTSPIAHKDWKYKMTIQGKDIVIGDREETLARVKKIYSPPRYVLENRKLRTGTPARNLVVSHGDRARISPIAGCGYSCWFCNLPRQLYMRNSIDELFEAFEVALIDDYLPVKHAIISGGTPQSTEDDYSYCNQVLREFPSKYPEIPFDVMLSPRSLKPGNNEEKGYEDFLLFLADCNINEVSVNLELHGQDPRRMYIPEKNRIGMEGFLSFIEKGVKIMGAGKIRSMLIVGLEPIEESLKGVKAIAEMGGIPVLSAFIPAAGTFLATQPAPDPDSLLHILKESHKMLEKYSISLGPNCQVCSHNAIS